ncbi:MAG TPA: YtxH domain-containing protein [Polyangiaceae bacterium]|nr:YtxH domain-containing protein [Polyangiaceae bacterium]
MSITDSIQNLRVVSELAVQAYDSLVRKGLWPQKSRGIGPLNAVALVGLGAVVGAGVALALAPSAGSELRSSLGEKLRDLSKEWLSSFGLETQTAGVDVRGEGGERAEAQNGEAIHGAKNGTSSRRKHASHGSSSAS